MGDVGSILGQGTKILHAAEKLSPRVLTREPCTTRKDSTWPSEVPSCHNWDLKPNKIFFFLMMVAQTQMIAVEASWDGLIWLYFEESPQDYLMHQTWDMRKTENSRQLQWFWPEQLENGAAITHQGRLWMQKVWERRAVLCWTCRIWDPSKGISSSHLAVWVWSLSQRSGWGHNLGVVNTWCQWYWWDHQ